MILTQKLHVTENKPVEKNVHHVVVLDRQPEAEAVPEATHVVIHTGRGVVELGRLLGKVELNVGDVVEIEIRKVG